MTPGLLQSAREVLAVLLDIGQTRLQLASTELEQERLYLTRQLLLAALALFFLGVSSLMGSLWLVVLFWDEHRLLVLGLITLAYLAAALACVWRWRAQARRKPALLASTVAELKRDAEALRSGVKAK
jgi:uncharacterized membrane protein YqjE